MKAKDYNQNIEIYDKELERLNDALTTMDPTTKEYAMVADAIKKLNESKLLEHKCYSEHKEHLVPDWIPKFLSIGVTAGLGGTIVYNEVSGKVIGSAAVALLNKLKF